LKAAIAAPSRTPANVARDVYRHPYETLTFFGIKPTMTVVELAPGGGWYTEILAPYLRDHGKLIAAGNDLASTNEGERKGGRALHGADERQSGGLQQGGDGRVLAAAQI
jgi:predicted methyltransferase